MPGTMPNTFHTLACLFLQQPCEESSIIILSRGSQDWGDYAIVQGQAAVTGEARI